MVGTANRYVHVPFFHERYKVSAFASLSSGYFGARHDLPGFGRTYFTRLAIEFRPFLVFGRVPLFYYLLQWYVAHGLAVLLGLVALQPVAWQFMNFNDRFGTQPPNTGFRLWVVYVLWILGVLLLYPLCKWYADLKRRRNDWWLSYL